MKCPVCENSELLMTERQGVEIDYCSNCRGIWLDRGELDKILEKTDSADYSKNNSGARNNQTDQRDYDKHDDYHTKDNEDRKKKKGGLLGDLLDF